MRPAQSVTLTHFDVQTFIEGVLAAEKKQRPNTPGIEFSRLFKTVWESFGKFQVFHTAGEVSQQQNCCITAVESSGHMAQYMELEQFCLDSWPYLKLNPHQCIVFYHLRKHISWFTCAISLLMEIVTELSQFKM